MVDKKDLKERIERLGEIPLPQIEGMRPYIIQGLMGALMPWRNEVKEILKSLLEIEEKEYDTLNKKIDGIKTELDNIEKRLSENEKLRESLR